MQLCGRVAYQEYLNFRRIKLVHSMFQSESIHEQVVHFSTRFKNFRFAVYLFEFVH
jgi:hypothetical protein